MFGIISLFVVLVLVVNGEELSEAKSNTTLSDLVQRQTEQIKKIVADQQVRLEYPVITKIDPSKEEQNTKKEQQIEKFSLEELKIHCQHLSKLLNANKTNEKIDSLPAKFVQKAANYKRPVYVSPKYPNKNGFYITTQATTTKKPTVKPANVKYIRLEPVILQKTILNDGRTIYYWHKSLPSAIQYDVKKQEISTTAKPEVEDLSTTTASYGFRNFFPFYYGSYKQEVSSSTTEKSTTTSTTTTAKPSEKREDLMFAHQLRFVVPVPYDDKISVKQGFDPYAYYPKDLQPSTINVQVPYTPNYSMIKSIAIPNKSELDNVDV